MKKTMVKRITAFFAAGCMLLATGCGAASSSSAASSAEATSASASSAAADALTIAFVSPLVGGSAWGNAQRGFEDACKEKGYEGIYMGPVTVASVTEMVDLAENAISNGCDVLLGAWNNAESYNATLQRAKDKDIPIIGVNYTIPDYTLATIGQSPELIGSVQAETLAANFPEGEQINVVYIQGKFSSQVHTDTHTAFLKRLLELRPDAVEVSWQECNSDIAEANQIASSLYLKDSSINAFVLNDGNGSVGVAAFVKENNLSDKIYLQTMDGGPEILQALTDGYVDMTVVQDWYAMGQNCVQLAEDIYNGKEVAANTPMEVYSFGVDGAEKYAQENNIDWVKS
ncbi:MAG: sugar ABC transporter substrate-binding protein [Oscillospiraceae bacterium]